MGHIKNFLCGERVDKNSLPPYFLALRSSKVFIIFTIAVAVFTDIFLYGIIVPVIPFALSHRADVPENSIQKWMSVLLAVYGGALLVGSPISGFYADRSPSRRLPLLLGLVALGSATVMLCLAKVVWLIVFGRILQGFAAAVVWTVGTALLVDTIGEKQIGEALGWVGTSMGAASLLAPLLGGIVYEKAGYYAVYYMAFGLVFLDICLRLALIEKKIAKQWIDVDEPATTEQSSSASDEEIQQGVEPHVEGQQPGNNNVNLGNEKKPQTARSKWPPVITLLASRRLLTALWGCVVQGSLMTAFDSVIPLFVQRTFNWNSIGAGLIFLAITFPSFLGPLAGILSDKYGPRWLAFSGFIFAIPFWVLLRLVTHNSIRQKVLFCALLFLIGIGLSIALPPLMAEITYIVEARELEQPGRFGASGAYAQAYGLFIAAFAAGALIGPVWSGYVADSAGWGTMSWSLGLLSFAGAVPVLLWTGGNLNERNAKSAHERAFGVAALPASTDEEAAAESASGEDSLRTTLPSERNSESGILPAPRPTS